MRLDPLLIGCIAVIWIAESAGASCTGDIQARFKLHEKDPRQSGPSKAGIEEAGRACFWTRNRHPLTKGELDAVLAKVLPASDPLVTNPPADIAQFCPAYSTLPAAVRLRTWHALFRGMIGAESSGFRDVFHWESANPASRGEFSVGLIQLSLSNARPYGCGFSRETDLEDPTTNLSCAVRIMRSLATPRSRTIAQSSHSAPGQPARIWHYLVADPGGIGGDGRVSMKVLDQSPLGRPPLAPAWSGAAVYWRTLRSEGARGRVLAEVRASVPECAAASLPRR